MGGSENDVKEVLSNTKHRESSEPQLLIQPANYLIVNAFFAVCKYWDRAGMEAIRVSLDPIKVNMRLSKFTWYKTLSDSGMEKLWEGLDVMEQECLSVWRRS